MTTSDRDQVIEQMAHVAHALDTRDWTALRALLTEAATAYGKTGPDEIIAQVHAHLGGVGPTQHLLGNHRVSINGDEAHVLTYARVHHVGAGPMTGSFYECMGEYDDRWLRTPAGWKLNHRHFGIQISLGDFAVLRGGDA